MMSGEEKNMICQVKTEKTIYELTIDQIEYSIKHIKEFRDNEFIQLFAVREIIDRFSYANELVQLNYYAFNNISEDEYKKYLKIIDDLAKKFDKKYKMIENTKTD